MLMYCGTLVSAILQAEQVGGLQGIARDAKSPRLLLDIYLPKGPADCCRLARLRLALRDNLTICSAACVPMRPPHLTHSTCAVPLGSCRRLASAHCKSGAGGMGALQ